MQDCFMLLNKIDPPDRVTTYLFGNMPKSLVLHVKLHVKLYNKNEFCDCLFVCIAFPLYTHIRSMYFKLKSTYEVMLHSKVGNIFVT